MENNEKKVTNLNEEKFFRTFFIVSFIILLVLIAFEVISWGFMLERAIRIFSFWFIIFVCIFVPRRLLKRSKKFRYLVLYIRKHYPLVFYYRHLIEIITYINFFFRYTAFYLERILRYFLVGTKIKWLKPYRKNWEKGEFYMLIILEGYRWVHYLVLYVLKIFYEIIKFFDNASIYRIVRSRILGFMMITIGYIIIGVNFFIIYVLSMIIIAMIFYILNIYVTYIEWMKKYTLSKPLDNLSSVLVLRGFVNKLEFFSKLEIWEFRSKTLLHVIVIKNKYIFVAFLLFSIKRKYGLKMVTKCWLNINALTEVEEKTLIAVNFLNLAEKEKEKIKIIKIASKNFATNFLKKKEWFEVDSAVNSINEVYDNFSNVMETYGANFCNLLEFKLYFVFKVMFFVDENKQNFEIEEVNVWRESKLVKEFYLGTLKNYFEFKDIYIFIKDLDKKILLEGGILKFTNKDIIIRLKEMIGKYHDLLYSEEELITKEEYAFLVFFVSFLLMQVWELDVYTKEVIEIIKKNNYTEAAKTLKKKGLLNDDMIDVLRGIGIEF